MVLVLKLCTRAAHLCILRIALFRSLAGGINVIALEEAERCRQQTGIVEKGGGQESNHEAPRQLCMLSRRG